jgi:hypothetical protein
MLSTKAQDNAVPKSKLFGSGAKYAESQIVILKRSDVFKVCVNPRRHSSDNSLSRKGASPLTIDSALFFDAGTARFKIANF